MTVLRGYLHEFPALYECVNNVKMAVFRGASLNCMPPVRQGATSFTVRNTEQSLRVSCCHHFLVSLFFLFKGFLGGGGYIPRV